MLSVSTALSHLSMEDNNSLMPCRIIFAFDAHKERSDNEFKNTINGIRLHRDMIHGGDTVLVVGVLHKILHPCKCLLLRFNQFLLPFNPFALLSFVIFGFVYLNYICGLCNLC